MFIYVFSIVMIVASNVIYNICQKSTPQKANPMLALLITYITAALITAVAYAFTKTDKGFIQSIKELNWTSLVLGISIIGLEFGYLLAYRAGWNISTVTLIANIILAIMLIPVGLFIYKESFELTKVLGAVLCIGGLILINR